MTVNPNSAPPAQFNITNMIGVDVAANPTTPASSASSTQLFYPENNNPNLSPGTIVMAGGGATYVFCQVGTVGSVNTGDFVSFTMSVASTFSIQQLGTAQAVAGARVGVYQGSAIGYGNGTSLPASSSTVTQWCWIALSGSNLVGNVASSTTLNAPLFVAGSGATVSVGTNFGPAGSVTSVSGLGFLNSVSTTALLVAGVVGAVTTASGGPIAIVTNPMMIVQYTSAVPGPTLGPY